jgi:hypothetical protein
VEEPEHQAKGWLLGADARVNIKPHLFYKIISIKHLTKGINW